MKALNQRLGDMTKALATTFPQRVAADAVRFSMHTSKNQSFTDRELPKFVLRYQITTLSFPAKPSGPHWKTHACGGCCEGPVPPRSARLPSTQPRDHAVGINVHVVAGGHFAGRPGRCIILPRMGTTQEQTSPCKDGFQYLVEASDIRITASIKYLGPGRS
ncbi:MAG: hypothetical protein U0V45_09430 [Flavobacteriales bacterium]